MLSWKACFRKMNRNLSFTRIETNQPLTAGIDLTYRFN